MLKNGTMNNDFEGNDDIEDWSSVIVQITNEGKYVIVFQAVWQWQNAFRQCHCRHRFYRFGFDGVEKSVKRVKMEIKPFSPILSFNGETTV
jgi:hypothetical protein